MDLSTTGFAGLSRADLAHRLWRIVQVRRLTAADLAAHTGLAADQADALMRGRVHQFTADQLRAALNGLCQRSPDRRR